MPIYEYVCQRCGHELEIIQKMSDPVLQTCPKCHTKKLSKKMSNSSFVLKGTGWYKTDYPKASAVQKASPIGTALTDKSSADKASTDKVPTESKPAASKPVETKSKPDSK